MADATFSFAPAEGSLISKLVLFIKNNPREYGYFFIKHLIRFWSPLTAPMMTGAKLYKSLTWVLIFPLAFWGMFISRRFWNKAGLLIAFIFCYSLLHAASYVDTGLVYRYPIQPFLCIFAAYGLWRIYHRVKINK